MIDTAALRKRILDLAIQGLLTPDVTIDECVNSKVNNILIENEIANDIVQSDIPFEIKNTWCWIKLGWIMGIERGGSPRPIKAYITEEEDGINWIKIGDVSKDGKYIEKTKEKIKAEGEKKSRHVYPGDFLLTNSMSFGRPYITKIDGCVHDGWLILRNTEKLFDMNFLYHLLSSSYVYNQFSKKASGATVDNLNIDKVADAIIPLPPVEEQKIIVEKVEEMMQYIETIANLQIMYSTDLEVLKSKIIDAGIQGKLTEQLPEDGTAKELLEQIVERQKELVQTGKIKKPKNIKTISDEEIPFEIPDNWSWEKWGNVINVVSARRVHQSDWRKEGIPFYRAREIAKLAADGTVENDLFISQELFDEFSMDRVPQPGDLMVSAVGTLGKTYVVEEGDIFYYKDASVLCFENYGGLNPYYLRYLMQSSLMKNQIEGNSGGTTVDTLTMVRMIQYILPIPPLAEQTRIVDKIDEMLSIVQG